MRRGLLVCSLVLSVTLVLLGEPAVTAKPLVLAQGGITYVHDDAGRLTAVIDTTASVVAKYQYDADGNITAITRPSITTLSIFEFTPKTGTTGTTVTIYGTAFIQGITNNTVKFNGTTATVSAASVTHITATVPSGATTGAISVTNTHGTVSSSQNFTKTASLTPTIGNVSPTIAAPGSTVTLTGTNFQTTLLNNNVAFNLPRAKVTAATATSISATVPPGGSSGPVYVGTPYGLATSSTDLFVPPPPYLATDVAYTNRMTIGSTLNNVNNGTGKIALVLFSGTRGQRVSLDVTNVSVPTSCLSVAILDPTGSQLGNGTCPTNATEGFVDAQTLPFTASYTIAITPNLPGTSGSLSLTLATVSDITGTLSINGGWQQFTTTTKGQNAIYSFAGTQGQQLVACYQIISGVSGWTVSVVGPAPTKVVEGSSSIGASFSVTLSTAAAPTRCRWIQTGPISGR
jgi:YD repeat-containing protein